MNPDYFVKYGLKYHSPYDLRDPERYTQKNKILCIGEVFSLIRDIKLDSHDFLEVGTAVNFIALMKDWEHTGMQFPVAILIHKEFIPKLNAEGFVKVKEENGFRNTTVLVFSDSKDQLTKSGAFSIDADDFFHKELHFSDLVFKIEFYSRLKVLGVGRKEVEFNQIPRIRNYVQKRAFDLCFSLIVMLLCFPIFLIIAILIRLESSGPVFYISKRAGFGYKIFDFYKFRTMHVGADKELVALNHLNQYNNKETDHRETTSPSFFKLKDDPRVTRVGKFLRNTSLDEIPQLLNVIKGDMSLVGNRPLPLYEAQQLTNDESAERFLASSGLTGLWQVMKRGTSEMSDEERILLDKIYARKNSIWFDLKIIFLTIPALIQKESV